MSVILFLGLICVIWMLFVLTKNTNENLEHQREILHELKQLKELAERADDKVNHSSPAPALIDARKSDSAEPPEVVSKEVSKAERISINEADIETLQSLPGVGKALAQKIIDARPYNTIDDLVKVSGVSQDMLLKLKDSVSL